MSEREKEIKKIIGDAIDEWRNSEPMKGDLPSAVLEAITPYLATSILIEFFDIEEAAIDFRKHFNLEKSPGISVMAWHEEPPVIMVWYEAGRGHHLVDLPSSWRGHGVVVKERAALESLTQEHK